MNLVLIITNLATGGAEGMLLKLLQRIDRNRFNPTVVSLMGLGDIGPRIQSLGIPVHALGMDQGKPSLRKFWKLVRLLRQLRPDVVHTWMYHADLAGGLAARLAGQKRIVWGIRHSDLSEGENKRATLWVVKACALLSRWIPARILSCSRRARDVHAAVGYEPDKMEVIPNGFDLACFVPDTAARSSVRTELGLPPEALLVGLVARFDPQKNHIGFVHAAALLHAQLTDVHFVLAGAGIDDGNAALNIAIARAGLQEHVHLLGRRDDIPRLMAALDVLASSSHGEAFPNVLGEAMACGVPCAVTDVGDSAEIVGNTGRVVPAGDMAGLSDEILALLRLPVEKRMAMGMQARARVAENYEIGHVVDLYQEFYERIMGSSNQGIKACVES